MLCLIDYAETFCQKVRTYKNSFDVVAMLFRSTLRIKGKGPDWRYENYWDEQLQLPGVFST